MPPPPQFLVHLNRFMAGCPAGGKCQHRVGCFFSLQMKTWEDALLALSVMQAVADDVCRRWGHMPTHELKAARKMLVGLQPVRTAHKTTPPQSHPRTTPATRHSGRKQAGEAMMEGDMAALHAAGVADVTPLFPPPLLIICENDDTPPNDWVGQGPASSCYLQPTATPLSHACVHPPLGGAGSNCTACTTANGRTTGPSVR